MKYFPFYNKAKELLIDSLASLWFKGQAREQEYLKRVLTEDEPLFAEPVFQSIFPWEESKDSFEAHSSKLGLLTSSFVNSLSSEDIDEDLRFPLDRHPYKHQTESWKTMLSNKPQTIVVTSGTGSGKTECFMIPVLQDLAKTNEKNCVQAIFLYPLNALMKSQQKRIHAWCKALPEKITYAIYNGDTDKENRSERYTTPYYPQLITRPQIRRTPPQILFTNPTMLNYMLVRAEDRDILEKSKGKLRWILLDEAHTYTGSSAAELSLQIRRVLDAFGVTIDQVNFAVTSATIGDENDPKTSLKLKTFVSQLTGKPIDDIKIIGGRRIIPGMAKDVVDRRISDINDKFGTRLTISDIERLRKKLNSSPVLKATEIGKIVDAKFGNDISASLEIVDALGDKVRNLNENGTTGALLPTRAHFFVRSISGVYVCTNSACSRHKGYRLPIGSLTTYQNMNCPVCKSRMLEIATCSSCGSPIVMGETSTTKGFRMHTNVIDLDKALFYEQKEDLIEAEELDSDNSSEQNETDGYTRFYFAVPEKPCQRKNATLTSHIFNHQRGKIELAPEQTVTESMKSADKKGADDPIIFRSLCHSKEHHILCPHCGNNLSKLKKLDYLRLSATQIGRTLATLLLDNAEPIDSNDTALVYEGRKYIAFTDSRQGSARSAMGLNQDVERSWIRSSIFHKLADMRLNEMKSGGLTPDEEEMYKYLSDNRDTLPPIFKVQLQQLEAKKDGSTIVPKPDEVSWSQLSQPLENDSNFKKLYEHIEKARGHKNLRNAADYLKALLVDQFGWIPKRANSLETMGFVRLVYPALKSAKCPALLLQKNCTDSDWQNFLKICVDYVIRGGRHYMLSGEYKDFLTQNKYCSPIYPSNSELRKNGVSVSKWFKVNIGQSGVSENQNRLVLLLCAVLGYEDISQINQTKIAGINSLLDAAWDFLKQNVLEATDVENQGYMLDLTGDKVKLQLIEKGYLCPVDNVIIDTPFCGYSPRMNGYIGRENFDRFRIQTEFVNPYFPFKAAEQTEDAVMEWIENNLSDQKAAGVFGVMNTRVLASKPIFISAEHSAQQSSEDLDKYEKDFNGGKLNILSCSTTMEMGVDIGGITEVVMNNVPPKSSNYLQRAGRAGRRSETKALALTVCAPNPIGAHTWNNPDYPITHVTETPLLKLESRQLIQRHVNALIFASFVANQGGIRVTATIKDFFISAEGLTFYDKFLNYIDRIISGNVESLQTPYAKLVLGTALGQISLSDVSLSAKKNIAAVNNVFTAHMGALDKALDSLKKESGTSNAIRAIERQKDNLLKTSLLSYLAENSFLPSAGIPVGLVECLLGGKETVDGNSPTLHISQAISAYAPGNPVVKNEWVYQPSGIRLKTKYDDTSSRYIIQNCTHCGYTTIIYGSARTDCPKCGHHGSMHGIKDISISTEQRFTEVVEPAAFTVAWDSAPTRKLDSLGGMNFIQPILLEMDAWQPKTSSARISIRCSTPRSEILFYNKGVSGYGYAFCPYCGRMKSESTPDITGPVMPRHKHLLASTPCPGGEHDGAAVRRHVLLVGRYQTDFVEIKFYDKDNNLVEDSETLYSLGVILSRKLTELLGVNDGEIEFGYDGINHSIFIYDTALGGAGYSLLFREYKDKVLEMALSSLEECDCEKSCTKCLIDRRSQWYLNYLNRQKALEWLRQEVKARVAPKEIMRLIPDACAVTSDITTEFYQLTRNKDVSDIKLFINDNISEWATEAFPFRKILTELSIEGVTVSYILPRVPEIKLLSSADSATLISEVFKSNFKASDNSLPSDLHPMMVVTMNDGTVKTYFGKDVNTLYSHDWGSGDIFTSVQPNSLVFTDIDGLSLLNDFSSGGDSFMFEYRIMEHSSLCRFFDAIKTPERDKWDRIISNMRGKSVSVEYSDRYLKTPLGCMLLARIISGLKNDANLNIQSVKVKVTAIRSSDNNADLAVNSMSDFNNSEKRNDFLSEAISKHIGIIPEIEDSGYVEHERCLTVKADNAEVCIRPDAGVSRGWAPFGNENAGCSDRDFRNDWEMDLPLFNKQQRGSGILYTVSYKQL